MYRFRGPSLLCGTLTANRTLKRRSCSPRADLNLLPSGGRKQATGARTPRGRAGLIRASGTARSASPLPVPVLYPPRLLALENFSTRSLATQSTYCLDSVIPVAQPSHERRGRAVATLLWDWKVKPMDRRSRPGRIQALSTAFLEERRALRNDSHRHPDRPDHRPRR